MRSQAEFESLVHAIAGNVKKDYLGNLRPYSNKGYLDEIFKNKKDAADRAKGKLDGLRMLLG